MAYNRFNPDSLPSFAEPERRNSANQQPSGNYGAQGSGGPSYGGGQQQTSGYDRQYNDRPSNDRPYNDRPNNDRPYNDRPYNDRQYSNRPPPLASRPDVLQPGPGRGQPSPRQPSPRQQPPANYGYMSPPPANNYGRQPQGTSPPHSFAGRQQPMSRPPPTPAPPNGPDPALYPLFKAVDKDGSGQLSERELRAALVNGDWTSFDPHTVRMMIRMFDSDRSGTIGFEEFCGLWGFLAAWRSLFDRFDADRSGNISYDEFTNALVAFGYRLSPGFVDLLFRTYDKRGEGAISFDMFVQSCISLKRMTDVFKKYDDDRDGFITLSFEDFLTEIIRQR